MKKVVDAFQGICYYSFRLMRSGVAQLVEQVAVNHFVGSSSLSSGAIFLFDDRSNPELFRITVRISDNLQFSGILPPPTELSVPLSILTHRKMNTPASDLSQFLYSTSPEVSRVIIRKPSLTSNVSQIHIGSIRASSMKPAPKWNK